MAQKLRVYKISSVDLVDEGSCGSAHIRLFKRKEGETMTWEEFMKSLSPDEQTIVNAQIEKAKKQGAQDAEDALDGGVDEALENPDGTPKKDTSKGAVAKVAKRIKELNATVEDLKKSATPAAQSEEEILKNANVDPAIKALLETSIAKSKAAEAEVIKMREAKEQAEFIAKAKEVEFIPEAETKVVELFKSIKGVDGAVDKAMEIFKSVSKALETSELFKAKGSNHQETNNGDEDEAWNAIEKAADELVIKNKMTKAKAIDHIIKTKPELYNAYVEAMRKDK